MINEGPISSPRVSRLHQAVVVVGVVVPFLGLIAAVSFWWGRGLSWTELSLFLGMYIATGLGEGWHNNHHAFPASARHGLRWWELDLSYLVKGVSG